MNRQINRLFTLFCLLFMVLIGFTSYWTIFDAKSLKQNANNRRPLLEEARIKRGVIRSESGELLARSRSADAGTFVRSYPAGELFAHTVGYSFTQLGRAGLEQVRNGPLVGEVDAVSDLVNQLTGQKRRGQSVITTLDPVAQRAAVKALGGQRGSVVAIEPATGKVRVMVSLPSFDPNELPSTFDRLNRQSGSPLLNRATQSGYPPGSTFKVVTAAAALDSGRFEPDSKVDGRSGQRISGVPLNNFNDKDFGQVSLTDALTFSVNTAWAKIGERLGVETVAEYMERFGFYSKPPIDLPASQVLASGERSRGKLLDPTSGAIDVGRMAIGQDRLSVTPLQMALVSAAIANGGELMQPQLTSKVVDADGRTKRSFKPRRWRQAISRETADQLTEMMSNVVREGTGTAAALQGVEVAGKTGTAEIVVGSVNQPWFIGFAPVKNPKIAIAVTVERSSGQGGTVAAPIAQQVLKELLR